MIDICEIAMRHGNTEVTYGNSSRVLYDWPAIQAEVDAALRQAGSTGMLAAIEPACRAGDNPRNWLTPDQCAEVTARVRGAAFQRVMDGVK